MALSLDQPTASILEPYTATWQDYVAIRDNPDIGWRKLSFHQDEMGTALSCCSCRAGTAHH
jgi:hypothetical protein